MLSPKKLIEVSKRQGVTIEDLARAVARGGVSVKTAVGSVKNWAERADEAASQGGRREAAGRSALVEPVEISDWHSSYQYAPMAARRFAW